MSRILASSHASESSIILYGNIAVSGYSSLADSKTDFNDMRNVLIMAVILIFGLGFEAHPVTIGSVQFTGLAISALAGIVLNLILPGNNYNFEEDAYAITD